MKKAHWLLLVFLGSAAAGVHGETAEPGGNTEALYFATVNDGQLHFPSDIAWSQNETAWVYLGSDQVKEMRVASCAPLTFTCGCSMIKYLSGTRHPQGEASGHTELPYDVVLKGE